MISESGTLRNCRGRIEASGKELSRSAVLRAFIFG